LGELDLVTEEVVKARIMERERKRTVPPVLVELRMKHYVDKRNQKISLIKEERQVIIDELEYGSKMGGKASVQNSMMAGA